MQRYPQVKVYNFVILTVISPIIVENVSKMYINISYKFHRIPIDNLVLLHKSTIFWDNPRMLLRLSAFMFYFKTEEDFWHKEYI